VRDEAESAEETDADASLCRSITGDVSRVNDAGRALDERLSATETCGTAVTSDLYARLSGLTTRTVQTNR